MKTAKLKIGKDMETNLNEAQTKIQHAMVGGCAGIRAVVAGDRIRLTSGSKHIGFVAVDDAGPSFDFRSFALLKNTIKSALAQN